MHSFGIAFDINPDYSAYWLWGGSERHRWVLPVAIVREFEKEGFIWGGYWYHFDTMHFEYRPELLLTTEEARSIVQQRYPELR